MKKIIVLIILIIGCKGYKISDSLYKDNASTTILKKIYIELKKDDLNIQKIASLTAELHNNGNINNNNLNNDLINSLIDLNEGAQGLIHLAVLSTSPNAIEAMRLLLERGANINLQNHKLETALHLACEIGDLDKVKFLIKSGADIRIEDKHNTIPLIAHVIDCENLNLEVIAILLNSLQDVNSKIGPELKTILHFVCEKFGRNPSNIFEVIRMLIEKGADINARDSRGNTILHNLVISSLQYGIDDYGINLLERLIRSYRLDYNAINKNLKTVQHLAVDYGEESLIGLFERFGLSSKEIKNTTANRLITLIKSYGNIDIDEGRMEIIQEVLDTLWISAEDFEQENIKFLSLLAATFYARWTQDELVVSIPTQVNIEMYSNVDRTLSLKPLVELMGSVKNEDVDEDLKAVTQENIQSSISRFISTLGKIHNGTYMNGRGNPLTKVKLQKLVTLLPQIIQNNEKKSFVINTLLRQFRVCEVGITLGLDQIFAYLGEAAEVDSSMENLIHQYLNDLRKNTLIQAVRKSYNSVQQQVHFDLQVLKHFSNELKLIEQYEDPYNIRYNFNPEIIRRNFYAKYTYPLIMELLKSKLTANNITKLFDFIKQLSGQKNVQLNFVNKLFFDKETYLPTEEFIKALLLNLGYIRGNAANNRNNNNNNNN